MIEAAKTIGPRRIVLVSSMAGVVNFSFLHILLFVHVLKWSLHSIKTYSDLSQYTVSIGSLPYHFLNKKMDKIVLWKRKAEV